MKEEVPIRQCRPVGSSHHRGLLAFCAAIRRGPPTWRKDTYPGAVWLKEYHEPATNLTMVDIDVYAGCSAEIFFTELPLSEYIAVGCWADHETHVRAAFDALHPAQDVRRRVIFERDRVKAADSVRDGSVDLIYLEKARRDEIIAWLPKLKPHGAFAGHDYSVHHEITMRWSTCAAVHSVFLAPDEVFEDGSWIVWPHAVKGRCRTGKTAW